MIHLLAWRPFLDPLDLHEQWYLLLLPLALGISVAYKAVRLQTMEAYWRQVAMMTIQIVGGIVLLAIAAYVVIVVVLPRIVPMAA